MDTGEGGMVAGQGGIDTGESGRERERQGIETGNGGRETWMLGWRQGRDIIHHLNEFSLSHLPWQIGFFSQDGIIAAGARITSLLLET